MTEIRTLYPYHLLSHSGKLLKDQRARQSCEREIHHFHEEPLLAYYHTQNPDKMSNQSDFTNSFRLTGKWLWHKTTVCVHSRSHLCSWYRKL